MKRLNACVERILCERTAANLIVKVGCYDETLMQIMQSAEDRTLTEKTLFDMASITKIVATTMTALIAMDRGLLSKDDPVSRFFAVPKDKQSMTIGHLMTHTIGIGHKSMLPCSDGYEAIQDYVLSIPSDIPIGSNVRYSCPAFILLGRIVEQVLDDRLDALLRKYVTEPLGMHATTFLPDRSLDIVNSNLTDAEKGLVNDYNSRYLGGVAGNAGVFSNAEDMTRFARMLLAHGAPIVSRKTFDMAAQNFTPGMSESRGLGFLCVDDRYFQAGGLFPNGSIGHCGHTGQSLFVDLESGFYALILSDATATTHKKHGKSDYDEVMRMRQQIHAAIKADLDERVL